MRIHVIFQLLLRKRKTLTEKINPFVELLCAVPFIIDDLLIALDQICSEKWVLFNARGQALILLFPLLNFVYRLLTSFVPSLHQFFLRIRTSKEEQLHFAAELQRFEEMFQSSDLFGTRERQFLLFVSAEHISRGQSTDAIIEEMRFGNDRSIDTTDVSEIDQIRSIRNENSAWDDPAVSTEILPNGIPIEFFLVDCHGKGEKQLIRGHESFEEVTEWNLQISCVDALENLINIHRSIVVQNRCCPETFTSFDKESVTFNRTELREELAERKTIVPIDRSVLVTHIRRPSLVWSEMLLMYNL